MHRSDMKKEIMYHSSSVQPSSSASACVTSSVTIVSKCVVYPDQKSSMGELKLSPSDLPMLSCHYIQKGLLFPSPPIPIAPVLLSLLTHSLSRALSLFPPLAGRLSIDAARIFLSCDDSGVPFAHAVAPSLSLPLLLPDLPSDVPQAFRAFFPLDGVVSYAGHFLPLAAFQLTELADGAVFLGCAANHAVVDGTSFWNFFNAWAELCRTGGLTISRSPDFRRNYFPESDAVLRFSNDTGPEVTFPVDAPLRERVFHFSREAILELKFRANQSIRKPAIDCSMAEVYAKETDDRKEEISSFQSLCAQLWRSVTRARKHLAADATTTFRMAVNCRHRLVPRVDPYYFGNAIQSIPTTATVSEVVGRDLRWVAALLHKNVIGYDDKRVRAVVAEWEAAPRCFPLGNPDGAGVTMGSSPRFPMYDNNDLGWGKPLAVRSGKANKFDGKMSAFPGRDGGGSVELEVCLAPETMAALLGDDELMRHVSEPDAFMSHSLYYIEP